MPRRIGWWGFVFIVVGACKPALEPAGFQVTVAPATQRITRFDRYPDHERIDLFAARGETEPFQIIVRSSGQSLTGVTVTASSLVKANGQAEIPPVNIKLFRQYYLHVLQPTGGYGWKPRIEYPGPLLPFTNPYASTREAYGAPFNNTRIGSAGKPYRRDDPSRGAAFPGGNYTGLESRQYVIQVVRGGAPGQATFRWSPGWRKGFNKKVKARHWSEPLTIPTNRHESVALHDGVTVRFTSGDGPGFVEGDTYHFNTYEAMNEVVWGDVYIPPGTPPGVYNSTVTVWAGPEEIKTLPLQVTVWDFVLPKTITTAFHGWLDTRFFEDCPDADILFENLQHDHRLDTQSIHGHNTPWKWNVPKVDWTSFDAAATPRLDGSAYSDGHPLLRFHLNMYRCGNERHWEKLAGKDIDRVKLYASTMARHLRDKDWFDRVYMYCRDEPYPRHMEGIARDIRAFREADFKWEGKFMVTSRPTMESPLLDLVDIWCVKYHWNITQPVKDYLAKRGSTLWAYVANTPHSPNLTYHVDSIQGYEPRLLKWAAWDMKAEGFLYWATVVNQAYPNPWTTPMNDFGACGDANFIYYGARNGELLNDQATPLPPINGPLPGFRLKQIREGMEDWEYLKICEALHGRAFTQALVREVYRSPAGAYGKKLSPSELENAWTQDPWAIYTVRKKVAEAILQEKED